jgi:hypothetical protein
MPGSNLTDGYFRILVSMVPWYFVRVNAEVDFQAMAGLSRFPVSAGHNKGLCPAPPSLALSNPILLKYTFWNQVDKIQREVIQYALECRWNCAREFVEGEGGMSTFVERETQSKLRFWQRIENLADDRWPKQLHDFKKQVKIKTGWDR